MFKEWLSDLKRLLYNKNMLSAFLLLIIVGFAFGYYFTEMIDKKNEYKQINIQDNSQEETLVERNTDDFKNIPANSDSENVKISNDTQIIFEREYIKSNDVDQQIIVPEDKMIGLNEIEFKQSYEDWNIISFSADEIVLHKIIDSYSPKHYKVGVVKKNGQDYIAVFYYNKEGQEVADYVSDKPISILSEHEQNKLIEGMIFSDVEEVYRMLENYDV